MFDQDVDTSAPSQESAPPEDFAAYEAWKRGDTTEEAAEEAPAADEAKTEPDSEPEDKQERDENGKFKPKDELPAGVQKRIQKEIDKAVAARREAERIRDEMAAKAQGTDPAKKPDAPAQPAEKPTLEKFETYEEYMEALTDWKVEQRLKAREQADSERKAAEEQKAVLDQWNSRVAKAKERHADFDEVLETVSDIPFHPAVQRAIATAENGPDLAYAIASNRTEAEKIARMDPMAAIREIGKIEARLTPAPETKKPAVSKAPRPVTPVSGTKPAEPSITDENISFADYERLRMKQRRR